MISDSDPHWGQSAHKDNPSLWKVRNYSARCHELDKHEYTQQGHKQTFIYTGPADDTLRTPLCD